MTRRHRFFHRAIWPALAIIVALGFAGALIYRPPPEPSAAPPRQGEPQR